jgi:hypothetical protein
VDNRKEFPSTSLLKLVSHLTYTVYWKVLLANPLYVNTSHMAKRSNKSEVAAILTASKNEGDALLDRKITLATEGFTTNKFCELTLRDRNRLSKENALTISEYIMAMKREINPRLNTIRTTIQFLSELSKAVDIEKKFSDMTRDDILLYLDRNRKLENDDPLHKWIGIYNVKRNILSEFFKWLYYPNVDSPKRRSELSAQERKPECIMGIPQLKRKR